MSARLDDTRAVGTPPEGDVPTARRSWFAQHWGDGLGLVVIGAAFAALIAHSRGTIGQAFWYDEQWRAYFVSVRRDWWHEIATSNAPMSAGWYLLERISSGVLGNHESVLRMANLLWLLVLGIAMYLVGRRWLPWAPATLLALLVMGNGPLLAYSMQFKPFVADAAGTMVALGGLMYARESEHSSRARIAAFAVATVGLLVATPAVFVVVPVLGCLLVEWWWRRRGDRVLLIGTLATLLLSGLHLKLFVMRQNVLTKGSYWDANFAPHDSLSTLFRFTRDQTRSFVPGLLSITYRAAQAGEYPVHLTHAWTTWAEVTVWVLLALGAWQAVATPAGRLLLVGTVSCFPLTLIASLLRLWPYGFVRTNFYVIPLLYLLCALGAVRLWGLVSAGMARLPVGRPRVAAAVAAAGALLVVAAVAAAPVTVAASVATGTVRIAHRPNPVAYERGLVDAVDLVRQHADASTTVVVAGAMAFHGWQYYMSLHDGGTGTEVPADRTALVAHGDPRLPAFLAAHPGSSRLYYFTPQGSTGKQITGDLTRVGAGGFCSRGRQGYPATGVLYWFDRC